MVTSILYEIVYVLHFMLLYAAQDTNIHYSLLI
jgi:hypothetical protein